MRDDRHEGAADRAALLAILRTSPPGRATSGAVHAKDSRGPTGRGRFLAVMAGMVALLFACALGGLMVGSVSIPAGTALSIVLNWLSGGWLMSADWREAHEIIIV
ncbi:hypothetical protein [Mesobaculum littorinae]|uniref:hypothetical protein n=1 Tax=Mesobaculum littorinae TaxID=2486419 RepID=UPI0019D49ED9|nr:hypothetical protein [Mesobaculum littorinae]